MAVVTFDQSVSLSALSSSPLSSWVLFLHPLVDLFLNSRDPHLKIGTCSIISTHVFNVDNHVFFVFVGLPFHLLSSPLPHFMCVLHHRFPVAHTMDTNEEDHLVCSVQFWGC